MRKILPLLIMVLAVSSCTIKEKMIVNQDNTGEFVMTFDMSEIMKQYPSGGENPQKMDTTMVFKDIIEENKDSVAALPKDKREALLSLSSSYMKMTMDEETGVMNMGIGTSFNSLKELKDISKRMKAAQDLAKSGNAQASAMDKSPLFKNVSGDSDVDYRLTKNSFSRKTDFKDDQVQPLDKDEDKMILDMFKDSKYIMEYQFARPIKSVSMKGAVISEDKKSVFVKKPLIAFLKDARVMDFEVVFE